MIKSNLLAFSEGKLVNSKVNKEGDNDFLLAKIAAFLLEIYKLLLIS